jgi:hypothetical protein
MQEPWSASWSCAPAHPCLRSSASTAYSPCGVAWGVGEHNQNTAELARKLQLRAPYVVPLNILQALAMSSIRQQEAEQAMTGLGSSSAELPQSTGASPSESRGLGSSGSMRIREHFNVYADSETLALLNRDAENSPNKDLLMQAFKDMLIITIKGIAAGMQNTG